MQKTSDEFCNGGSYNKFLDKCEMSFIRKKSCVIVIASEAKQSRKLKDWIASSAKRPPRNDGVLKNRIVAITGKLFGYFFV